MLAPTKEDILLLLNWWIPIFNSFSSPFLMFESFFRWQNNATHVGFMLKNHQRPGWNFGTLRCLATSHPPATQGHWPIACASISRSAVSLQSLGSSASHAVLWSSHSYGTCANDLLWKSRNLGKSQVSNSGMSMSIYQITSKLSGWYVVNTSVWPWKKVAYMMIVESLTNCKYSYRL